MARRAGRGFAALPASPGILGTPVPCQPLVTVVVIVNWRNCIEVMLGRAAVEMVCWQNCGTGDLWPAAGLHHQSDVTTVV